MKSRAWILASAVLACVASTAVARDAAADDHDPVNTVTISPLPLVFNRELDLEYERAVSDDFSLYAGPSLVLGTSTRNSSYLAGGVTVGARFFPGQAPRGFFIGAFGTGLYASASTAASTSSGGPSVSGTGVAYEAGGMLGYTFILADRLDLSLGLGAAYAHEQITVSESGNSATVGSNGVIPVLCLAVGVAF